MPDTRRQPDPRRPCPWLGEPAVSLPVLDDSRCTACGDCVRVCPADCLELAELPWLPRPLDCWSCGLCELVCPTQAIRLPTVPDGHRP